MTDMENDENTSEVTLTRQAVRFVDLIRGDEKAAEMD